VLRVRKLLIGALAVLPVSLCLPAAAAGQDGRTAAIVRFATFNASLNRAAPGQLTRDLSTPDNEQARKVAEVIQRNAPDVVLVNEFDYTGDGSAAAEFRANYLERSQHGAEPVHYRYAYTAPVNTGVPTGFDLNRDGSTDGPDDAYGFGAFSGQYGLLVLSKYPIDIPHVRTFQHFRWRDMPGALLPDDPVTPTPRDWYSPEMLDVLRLSSKSHWDLPIRIGDSTVHFLVAHPTPPSFDGPEKRNATRNHDEIRFWADYVTPGKGRYIYDDNGRTGGLAPNARFVIAGDHNADPVDGDGVPGAMNQLLHAKRVIDPKPGSVGAPVAARIQGGANETQRGNPYLDTGDFGDQAPGNLRVDYVLPSTGLFPLRGNVFWPVPGSPLARLNDASDHHLVREDIRLPR
jgi:hypothetical protein